MTTPPNRPQIQRPTLDDCRIVEEILRDSAIEEARRGSRASVFGHAMTRYAVLAVIGVVSHSDNEALRTHCRELAAQADQEDA